ncbi:unnamed protein product [Cyclocybe aegerita]|uniref:Uncharacterized protein n=1 Tax=Cyclocybe aegerita TaxID=1973307 RepID=A0A8S0XHD2_CYCAE|nr:unnamed protein product [Cyclocybe aegerita]
MDNTFTLTAFPGADLKLWLVGTFVGAVAYGIVVVLSLGCAIKYLQFLRMVKLNHHLKGIKNSRLFGHLLFPYVTMMFLVSTLAVLSGCIAIINMLFPAPAGTRGVVARFVAFGDVVPLVLAAWGADALMIWRCVVLYEDTAHIPRSLIHVLLCILALGSLGLGPAYMVTTLAVLNRLMVAFALMTAIFNFFMTTLIVLRLRPHQQFIQQALGEEYGSPYARLITMCVESAALTVIFNVAHVFMQFNLNVGLVLSHQLLVHVYAISALLIVFAFSLEGLVIRKRFNATLNIHESRPPYSLPPQSSETCSGSDVYPR